MKYKIGIICLFLILVYCVSAVCAADLNESNSEDLKLNDDKSVKVFEDDELVDQIVDVSELAADETDSNQADLKSVDDNSVM